jgi:hypothetical protein
MVRPCVGSLPASLAGGPEHGRTSAASPLLLTSEGWRASFGINNTLVAVAQAEAAILRVVLQPL